MPNDKKINSNWFGKQNKLLLKCVNKLASACKHLKAINESSCRLTLGKTNLILQ